jgi:hypothetical protein
MKKLNSFFSILLLLLAVLFAQNSWGQTTLISPTGDGGFETGANFAANGWIPVDHTTNIWKVGTATKNSGTYSAYVTNDAGTSNSYNKTVSQTSFFYRDITFSSGKASVLKFDWKGNGESSFDRVYVYMAPTSVTPIAGNPASSNNTLTGATMIGGPYNSQTTWQSVTINLGATYAGGTYRLIYMWQNDASGGADPALAIDNVSLIEYPSLTGNKTIKSSGGDYTTFTAAINDLNFAGVGAGGVTYNVDDDLVLTEDCPVITATGTALNPIVFQRTGNGTNRPVIKPTGTASSSNAGIAIAGGDYITFDGIDITIATGSLVEYGYLIRNASATDGAQNNTIKNSKIILNRTNTSSVGIMQSASTSYGGAFSPSANSGTNSTNKYYNITIENAFNGIWLYGSSSYYDASCEIGVTGGGTTTIGAATSNDIGNGSAASAYGIRCYYQNNHSVFNTEVRNVTTTASNSVYGISLENSQGTSSLYNNKVHDVNFTGTSTSIQAYGIQAGAGFSQTLNVYNNAVYAVLHGISSASATQVVRAIAANVLGSGTVNLYFNSARVDENASASTTAFYAAGGTLNVKNNIFANFSTYGATAKRYCWYNSSGTVNSSSNNILYINTSAGANNLIGYGSSADRASLQLFAASISGTAPVDGLEAGSSNADPNFTSSTNLTFAGTTPAALSGVAVAVTTDITGATRDASRPSIGAYETAQTQNDKSAPVLSNVIISGSGTTTPSVSVTLTDNSNSANNATVRLWYRLSSSSGVYTAIDADTKPSGAMNGIYTWNTSLAALGAATYNFYITARDDQGAGTGIWVNPIWTSSFAGFSASDPPNFTANPDANANVRSFQKTQNLAGGTYNVGDAFTLKKLTDVANELNNSVLQGNVIYELNSDYDGTTGETFPITFNQFTTDGLGSWTVSIRVKSGAGVRTTSGSTATGDLITLNGVDRLVFDGREGGTGTTKAWIISNTNTGTSTSTISFKNDAIYDTIRYCELRGANTSTLYGVAYFYTGTTSGNDYNTIDNCDIRNAATDNITNLPACAVYAYGTSNSLANDNNTISNCNIFNFWASSSNSYGIYIGSFNSNWIVTGNNLYQGSSRAATAAVTPTVIYITNTSGNNFIVTNNYIGGSSPNCGGSAWTVTGSFANKFQAMYLNVGTTAASSVQGNTINNIDFTTTSGTTTAYGSFCGIGIAAGNVNVGNTTGNTLGSSTIDKLKLTASNVALLVGINAASTGTVNISNNTIYGLTSVGTTAATGAYLTGIQTSGTAGIYTINNNTIGSTSIANSMRAGILGTTTGATYTVGITNAATGAISISGNTVGNLVSYGVNTSSNIRGIVSSAGVNTLTSNTVRDLSTPCSNVSTTSSASVIGISMTSTTTGISTLSQNTIFGLSNSHATAAVCVTGIHYAGPTTGTNIVARNLIYGLKIVSTSQTADMRGINFASGLANVQNNIIRLGYDADGNALTTGIQITGLYDVTSTSTTGMYFNSIYIGGTGVSTSTAKTYAFRSDQTSNARTYQNNIFYNGRSNTTSASNHYAVRVSGTGTNPTGLALNYNDYLANGTGAVFGYYNADRNDFTTWKSFVGSNNDVNSINNDPLFAAPTVAIPNLKLTTGTPCEGIGLTIAGITDDFEGDVRADLSPTDLGADAGDYAAAGIDMAPTALVSPAANGCYTSSENITVTIKNFSATTIDFSVNPVTVTITETTGGSSYNSSKVVNTGTLASNATQNVTLDATINMSTGGTYTFNASTSVTGDINTGNDNLTPVTRTVVASQVLPQTADFTGFTGANLTTVFPNWYEATGASLPMGTTSNWVNGTLGVTSAKINLYTNTRVEWIVGPKVVPTATSVLNFQVAITDFGNTNADPSGMQGTDDKVIVKISTNCGQSFSDLYTFNASNTVSITNTLVDQSIDLSAYAGQQVILAFFASDGPVDDAPDYDFHIDNVRIYTPTNMVYSSSISTQAVTSSINAGITSQQVLGVQVVTTGNLNPVDLTKLTINANGTTSVLDISNAKVWYTGTSSTFATTAQFGSTVISPTIANFDVTGTQALAEGTNYFWITYDVNSNAVNNNVIDAECASITIGGSDYVPTIMAPAGSRTIVNKTFTSVTGVQASTAVVLQGAANQAVLRLDFIAAGPATGSLLLNSIAATYSGSNATDIPASGVKLYWTTTTTFATTNLMGTVSLSGGVASFTGLNYNLPIGTTYIWVAFDIDAVATLNNTVDSKIATNGINVGGTTYNGTDIDPAGSRTIRGALSGDYLVGSAQTSPNYTTLTQAVSDLNSLGISSSVRFLLTDATYSISETFPLIINSIAGATASNTLTIKPNTGVTAAISGSASNAALVKILSSYVTIDGSNTSGGNTRDLTITNTSITSPRVILLGSTGTTPITNTAVKNCVLINGITNSNAVVVSDGSSIGTAGYFSNIIIQNNSIQKALTGIYCIASVASGNGSGLNISNNNLNTSGANAIRNIGIYLQGIDGATISSNTLGNFETASAENDLGISLAIGTVNTTVSNNTISTLGMSATSAYAPIGISVASGTTGSTISISGNTFSGITTSGTGTTSGIYLSGATSGVTITGNKISNIKNTNTGGYGANGIWLGSTSTSAAATVSNNVIYDIAGYGWASDGVADNGYGIVVTAGAGYGIYYNSVNMNTNQTPLDGLPAAINVTSGVSTAGAINLRNNIFVNSQSTGTQRYAIYSGAGATVFTDIDYNDYYTSGTNIGYLSSARTNIAAWRTATGKDANSVSANPTFASATDLRASAIAVNNKGVDISGITTDYTGTVTRTSPPDMGAYEFSLLASVVTGTPATSITSTGATLPGTVNANNESATGTFEYGLTNAYGSTAAWTPSPVTGIITTPVSADITGLLPNTLYYYRINATTPKGTANGTVQTFTTSAAANCTFTGTTSSAWEDATNWDNGIPGAITNVTIPTGLTNYPTLANPTTINNLTINSDISGTASLITNAALTVSGTTTAQRYIAKDNKWHFLSSPVAAQAIIPNFAPTTCDATFDFYKWDASADLTAPTSTPWVNLRATTTTYEPTFETEFAVGRGYLVAYSGGVNGYGGSETHLFTGNLNSGDKSIDVVYAATNKFNLIGNPYPSAINWNASGYTNRDTYLKDAAPSIWVWNGTAGQYGAYIKDDAMGTNDVTNVIAPNQGFFVEAISTGNFTIPNAARVHPGAQNFLKSTPVDLLKLKVSSTANTYSDEIIVNFNSNATANQGAAKWFSMITAAPSLYSVKNNKNFSINTLAVLNADLVVPVSFKAGVNGNYSIKASELASFTNLSNLILKDLQTGSMQNLLQNQVYNFAANTNDNANRFQLIFNSTSGINNPTNNQSVIYLTENNIQIQSENQIDRVEVYNAIGQLIYQSNEKSNQLSVNVSGFTRGTYIVRLITNQKIHTQKLVINN